MGQAKFGAEIAKLALLGRLQGIRVGLERAARLVEREDPNMAEQIRSLDAHEILNSLHRDDP